LCQHLAPHLENLQRAAITAKVHPQGIIVAGVALREQFSPNNRLKTALP